MQSKWSRPSVSTGRSPWSVMALAGGVCLALPAHVTAQDATWTGPGNEWTSGSNWNPAQPTDTALFTNNGAPTAVTISGNASIQTMEFTAAAPAYSFTVTNNASFAVNTGIINASPTLPSFQVNLGSTLTFGDGTDTTIGSLGNGTSGGGMLVIGPTDPGAYLTIAGGTSTTFSGSISGAGSLELGNGATTLTLTGASNGGSIGTIGGDLTLCDCFGGGLTIDGGSLTVNGLSRGITVFGGTLSVLNGGTLQDNLDLLVSTAMVVSGPSSLATVAGVTGIGIFGPGQLTISNGGVVNSQGGAEVDALFGTASVTVTGAGSTWNVGAGASGLAVGGGSTSGPGTLTIANGGRVNGAGIVAVGDQGPGTSFITVTGSGSTLTATGGLVIGQTGTTIGTLNVAAGGVVNAAGGTSIGTGSTLNLGTGGLSGAIATPAIVNDGAIVANFTDTLTLAADISGAGTLGKAGPGTLTLTGNNTYTGGTTVTGGLINFAALANFGTGMVTLNGGGVQWASGTSTDISPRLAPIGAGGAVFATNGNNVTLATALTGTGGVTKQGLGQLTLNGNNTYTGVTTVTGGTLAVNGSLAGSVMLGAGGTLGGSGTIGGLVANGGTLAPGNSIGTLTVSGNFSQSGGTYVVEANAAGQSDRVNVSGTATINGGTVQLVAAPGNYGASTTYTILNATGGVSGTYSSVSSNFAFLTPSLTYNANNVFLTLALQGSAFSGFGGNTVNQRNVGFALDQSFASATGDFATVIGALAGLSTTQAPAALNAISGQPYADFGTTNVANASLFMNTLGQQMALARSGSAPGARVALAQACAAEACDDARPLSAWFSGLGGLGSVQGDGNASTLTYNVGGAAAGIDYRFDPRFLVGLGVGYTHGTQWVNSFMGQGWTDSVSVAAYGSFTPIGPLAGFYADALVGYAYLNNQLQRQIQIPGLQQRTASGTTGANQFLAQVETGYKLGVWTMGSLTPFARFQTSITTQNAFTESGASSLNLNVAQQTTSSVRTVLGAEFGSSIPLGTERVLGLSLRLGWQHEYAYTGRPITASFGGAPSASFTVYGATPTRDAAIVGFSAMTNVATATQLYLRYDGELAAGTDNHALTAGLRMSW